MGGEERLVDERGDVQEDVRTQDAKKTAEWREQVGKRRDYWMKEQTLREEVMPERLDQKEGEMRSRDK